VLQLFLSSPKPSLRFAAVRALNRVAMSFPLTVTLCNLDLENMISDSNRSIATLAITTLLKTGSESQVERLMKQISSFMSEIADEFKVLPLPPPSLTPHLPCVVFSRFRALAVVFCLASLSLVRAPGVCRSRGWW
jgi:hypothetical protein